MVSQLNLDSGLSLGRTRQVGENFEPIDRVFHSYFFSIGFVHVVLVVLYRIFSETPKSKSSEHPSLRTRKEANNPE
jgi:hypothetical protein